MNARIGLTHEQTTDLLRLVLDENAKLRARPEEGGVDDLTCAHGVSMRSDCAKCERASPQCMVCNVLVEHDEHVDVAHRSCSPTLMTVELRRDLEALVTAIRARGDVGRSLRARTEKIAIAIGGAR